MARARSKWRQRAPPRRSAGPSENSKGREHTLPLLTGRHCGAIQTEARRETSSAVAKGPAGELLRASGVHAGSCERKKALLQAGAMAKQAQPPAVPSRTRNTLSDAEQ